MSESTELQRAVENLTRAVAELRTELVRKDVYDQQQQNIRDRIKDVTDDVSQIQTRATKLEDQRAADRRLVLTAFVIPFLLVLFQLYTATKLGTT